MYKVSWKYHEQFLAYRADIDLIWKIYKGM